MNNEFNDSFLGILVTDVNASIERRKEADSQANRRDLIRTCFAAIEGLVWILRENVISTAQNTYGLEDKEKAALEEFQYFVTNSGKISAQRNFIPLTSHIKFLARIAQRITKQTILDFSTKHWEQFQSAVVTRNRITHPKSKEDMHILDDEADAALAAFYWLLKGIAIAGERLVDTQAAYLGEFKDVLKLLESEDPETTRLYNALKAQSDNP